MDQTETTAALVRQYFDLLASDARAALALYADDVRYEVMGTTPISGVAVGRRAIVDQLFRPFLSRLEGGRLTLIADEVIAQGERAAVVAHSEAVSATGAPYRNRYVFVLTVSDGRITSIAEYMDTALVETAVFGRELRDSG